LDLETIVVSVSWFFHTTVP